MPESGRSRNGFPALYKKLSPLARLRWLQSEYAAELLRAGRIRPEQLQSAKNKLNREDRRIGRCVPSPNRLEEFREGYPFPPPAEQTPMRRATLMLLPGPVIIDEEPFAGELEIYWPPNFLTADGVTYDVVAEWIDHVERHLDLPRSRNPSAHALVRMEELGVRSLRESLKENLEPEDEASLRDEIKKTQNAV